MNPYYEEPAATIYLGDCQEILPLLQGFDLLLTDPPYGIGESNKKNLSRSTKKAAAKDYGEFGWDKHPVDPSVLKLARSLCTKQIIFGGNYYDLPPCKGWLVWDKENTGDFADGELAWNNLGIACRIKRHRWNGYLRVNQEQRFHPTQKPLDVMQWCISLAGDKVKTILDPWGGSGTTAVAAKNLGRHCTLIEKEERWVDVAIQRLSQEVLPLHHVS